MARVAKVIEVAMKPFFGFLDEPIALTLRRLAR